MAIAMRQDKQDLPYKDIRVRQALMMATDFNGMADVLYGGDAEILVYPISRSFKRAYMPMEESTGRCPRTIYSYNPEKAKQLLAEAGYPDGFKAQSRRLLRPGPGRRPDGIQEHVGKSECRPGNTNQGTRCLCDVILGASEPGHDFRDGMEHIPGIPIFRFNVGSTECQPELRQRSTRS